MFNDLVPKFKHKPAIGQNLLFNNYVKRIKQEKSRRWPAYDKINAKLGPSEKIRQNRDRLSVKFERRKLGGDRRRYGCQTTVRPSTNSNTSFIHCLIYTPGGVVLI